MKLLKKRTEKRGRKFKEMGMDKSEALQHKLHEESLLAQRLMLFLLFNSILLISFATLFEREAQVLLLIIPSIGIITCFFLILHTLGVKVELGALDKLLGEEGRIFAGRDVGFYVAALFLVVWGGAIVEVVC